MPKNQLHLELDERDRFALAELARILQTNRVQVIRWAIRYYATYGIWRSSAASEQRPTPLYVGPVDVGPDYREVS